MNILFLRPAPSNETIGLQHVMIVEPLELEVLAAIIGDDDSAVIVDMIIERKPLQFYLQKYNPDILCITGYITHVPVIKQYCSIAKTYNKSIVTITGGVHCEVCPEHFESDSIDYRVVRNATRTFPLLLQYIKGKCQCPSGVLKKTEKVIINKLPPFDFYFPFPNRTLTEQYRKHYFYIFHNKVALIKTAFGCPQKCTFCFCRKVTADNFHMRPLDDVIKELQQIKEKEIYIVDDDFLASKTRLESFLEKVENASLKKSYLIYGRADFIAKYPDLIGRFKKNGLRTVIVGLESFFDEELTTYNKKSSSTINRNAMKVLNSLKIDCFATVIVPPTWNKSSFCNAGKILRELDINYVNLQPLTPLPGTDLKKDDTGLLIQRNEFEKWDLAHVSIKPVHMSVAEFYREIIKLYNKVLFRPSVLFTYLIKYNLSQLIKMVIGTFRVRAQYEEKIRNALKEEL